MVYQYDIDMLLPKLTGPIREIVDSEIKNGNILAEVATAWPMQHVNVWFKKPFTATYRDKYPDITYCKLNDPKNWFEHYADEENGFMVAALFSI